MAIKKTLAERLLLAKRRDIPSPVVSSRSGFAPGEHADSRTGLVGVRSKRHGPLNSLDDGRSLPRGHHSVTSLNKVTAIPVGEQDNIGMLEYYDISKSKTTTSFIDMLQHVSEVLN